MSNGDANKIPYACQIVDKLIADMRQALSYLESSNEDLKNIYRGLRKHCSDQVNRAEAAEKKVKELEKIISNSLKVKKYGKN